MFYTEDPGLLFVHIPRTAGTSVEEALVRAYGGRNKRLRLSRKHISGKTLRKNIITKNSWDKAFKFTIIRNPWDRVVSLCKHSKKMFDPGEGRGKRSLNQLGLDDQVRSQTKELLLSVNLRWWLLEFNEKYSWIPYRIDGHQIGLVHLPQSMWLMQHDNIMLDKVYRFERLYELEDDLGLTLQNLNMTDCRAYEELYDDETRRWVARVYAEDIERWGYKF